MSNNQKGDDDEDDEKLLLKQKNTEDNAQCSRENIAEVARGCQIVVFQNIGGRNTC